MELHFAKTSKDLRNKENTASLDRIDSSKEYTIENIQWVHVVVNYMKQSYPQEEFIKWCHIISNYQSNLET